MGREEDVSGLAAAVSLECCPTSTHLKIIEVQSVILMTLRGDGNNTAWR